jgi:hypothetical protein
MASCIDGLSVAALEPCTPIGLDPETLRRCLRTGGLEVSAERAAALLPTVAALLAACERVVALELSCEGGSGPPGVGAV